MAKTILKSSLDWYNMYEFGFAMLLVREAIYNKKMIDQKLYSSALHLLSILGDTHEAFQMYISFFFCYRGDFLFVLII